MKLKQKAKQIGASIIIFVMLMTNVLMFAPSFKVSSDTKENVIKIAKKEQDTVTLEKEIKKTTSRNGAIRKKKETLIIYEFFINNEKKIYFETLDKANYQKDYLLRNTVGVSVNIAEIETDNKDSLSSDFEINNTIENYILKYKKKTTTNRKSSSVRTETKSAKTSETCYPTVSKTVSSGYGKRSRGFHTGIDISGNYGDNIFAYKSGTVVKVQYSNRSYGNMVLITHGDGTQTRYAHMSDINVSNGQIISCGQVIGHVGSTGNSTGNHLHFEIIINGATVNPYNYIF